MKEKQNSESRSQESEWERAKTIFCFSFILNSTYCFLSSFILHPCSYSLRNLADNRSLQQRFRQRRAYRMRRNGRGAHVRGDLRARRLRLELRATPRASPDEAD